MQRWQAPRAARRSRPTRKGVPDRHRLRRDAVGTRSERIAKKLAERPDGANATRSSGLAVARRGRMVRRRCISKSKAARHTSSGSIRRKADLLALAAISGPVPQRPPALCRQRPGPSSPTLAAQGFAIAPDPEPHRAAEPIWKSKRRLRPAARSPDGGPCCMSRQRRRKAHQSSPAAAGRARSGARGHWSQADRGISRKREARDMARGVAQVHAGAGHAQFTASPERLLRRGRVLRRTRRPQASTSIASCAIWHVPVREIRSRLGAPRARS